jgi:SAM-dependent methyltransferase
MSENAPRPPSPGEARQADPWLTFAAPILAGGLPGAAIDLACGAGHNALWLSRLVRQVLGVDVSAAAISAAATTCVSLGLEARFMVWDLEKDGVPAGPWSAMLVFHFLHRPLIPALTTELAPGGILVYKTHLQHPLRGTGSRPRSPSHLLRSGELLHAFSDLVPLAYREWAVTPSAYAALVARKPADHSR